MNYKPYALTSIISFFAEMMYTFKPKDDITLEIMDTASVVGWI